MTVEESLGHVDSCVVQRVREQVGNGTGARHGNQSEERSRCLVSEPVQHGFRVAGGEPLRLGHPPPSTSSGRSSPARKTEPVTHTRSSGPAAERAADHAPAAAGRRVNGLPGANSASTPASRSGGTHRGLFPYFVRWKWSKYPASSRSISGYCLSDDTASTTALRPGTGKDSRSVRTRASALGTLWAVSRITTGRSETSSIRAGQRMC